MQKIQINRRSITVLQGARNYIPVNAKYHAEERCENKKLPYNEKYEAELRELANDCLVG